MWGHSKDRWLHVLLAGRWVSSCQREGSWGPALPCPPDHLPPHYLYLDIPMTSRTVRAPYKSILWSSVIFTFFCVSPRTVSWAHSLLSTLVRTHRLLLGLIKLSKSLVFLSILCTVAKASIQNLFSGFVSVNLRTVRFLTGSTKSKKPFATSLFTTFFFLANYSSVSFPCLNKAKVLPSQSSGASEFTCLSYNPPDFYVQLTLQLRIFLQFSSKAFLF